MASEDARTGEGEIDRGSSVILRLPDGTRSARESNDVTHSSESQHDLDALFGAGLSLVTTRTVSEQMKDTPHDPKYLVIFNRVSFPAIYVCNWWDIKDGVISIWRQMTEDTTVGSQLVAMGPVHAGFHLVSLDVMNIQSGAYVGKMLDALVEREMKNRPTNDNHPTGQYL